MRPWGIIFFIFFIFNFSCFSQTNADAIEIYIENQEKLNKDVLKILKDHPGIKITENKNSQYRIKIQKPDPDIDYKISIAETDPDTDYKMILVNPEKQISMTDIKELLEIVLKD